MALPQPNVLNLTSEMIPLSWGVVVVERFLFPHGRISLTNRCTFGPQLTWKKFQRRLLPRPFTQLLFLFLYSACPVPTNHLNGDDSEVETERKWLDESQLTGLAQRVPSNILEAIVIEVRLFFFLRFFTSPKKGYEDLHTSEFLGINLAGQDESAVRATFYDDITLLAIAGCL